MKWLAGALLCALVVVAGAAAAHANLLSSDPAGGAELDAAPAAVTVVLSEPADPKGSSIRVRALNGTVVDDGNVSYNAGNTPSMRVGLLPGLGGGSYIIVWQALSEADGHVTKGSVAFGVGEAAVAIAPEDAQTFESSGAAAAARALQYFGLMLAFGATAYALWIHPSPSHLAGRARLAGAGMVVFALGALIQFGDAAQQSGLAFADAAGTAIGLNLLARAGSGVALGAVAFVVPARFGLAAAALAAVLGTGFTARFAHAAETPLGFVVDVAHIVAAGAWAGGLILLAARLWAGRSWTAGEVQRFSTMALGAAAVIVASGVASTWLIVGTESALDPGLYLDTDWGRTLAVKVGLVGLAFAFAAANRFAWVPRLDRMDRSFKRTVVMEAFVASAILVAAAFLTATSPATGDVAAPPDPPVVTRGPPPQPISVINETDELFFHLTVDPGYAGATANYTAHVQYLNPRENAPDLIRVRLSFTYLDADYGTTSIVLNITEEAGFAVAEGNYLFAPGAWRIAYQVQSERLYSERGTFEVDVPEY